MTPFQTRTPLQNTAQRLYLWHWRSKVAWHTGPKCSAVRDHRCHGDEHGIAPHKHALACGNVEAGQAFKANEICPPRPEGHETKCEGGSVSSSVFVREKELPRKQP